MAKSQFYAKPKLKQLREAAGYTQDQMAKLLTIKFGSEVSYSLYQKWELGERAIAPEQVLDLSVYFKIDYNELVTRK